MRHAGWLWVVLALMGCGSTSSEPTAGPSVLSAAEAEAFDNGIDLVASPQILEGRWSEEWRSDFDTRVSAADGVAIVTVKTMGTDVDLDRRITYRLLVEASEWLYGDGEKQISLKVSERMPGFSSVHKNNRRILDATFIAFLKRQVDNGAGVASTRWHLSPASKTVRERLGIGLSARRREEDPTSTVGPREYTVEHSN